MVQISTPWGDPNRGMGPVRRFLSNYFDLLLNMQTASDCFCHVLCRLYVVLFHVHFVSCFTQRSIN